MKNLFLLAAFLASTSAIAAEDLLNCKWENGEAMEPGICGTLRNSLPDEEKTRIHETLTKRANDEVIDRKNQEDAALQARLKELEEEEQARIRNAEEEEAARVVMCSKVKTRELTVKEKRSIAEQVKDLLKDPDSAKFKWMRLYGLSGVETYCGMVNAKNSYGGYTGYSIFSTILVKGQAKSSILDDAGSLVALCKEYCYDNFSKAKP